MLGRYSAILFIIVTVLLLATSDPLVASPDMGWHIRAGEAIVQTRSIPDRAWFTFTVPEYRWIDHEWAQQIAIYFAWHFLGLDGVRLLYALLGLILILVILRSISASSNDFSLEALLSIPIAGLLIATRMLRPQLVSALFFESLLLILLSWRRTGNAKTLRVIPILFLIWCNLHAGYPVGFLLLAMVFLGGSLEAPLRRKFPNLGTGSEAGKLTQLIPIGICSILVTGLNPYGFRIYEEILRTISDPYPLTIVAEWLPTSLASHSGEAFFVLSAFTFAAYFTKIIRFNITEVFCTLFFFAFGLSATRHTVFFILFALTLLLREAGRLRPIVERELRFITAAVAVLTCIVVLGFRFSQLHPDPNRINQVAQMYPIAALEALKGAESSKRIFHNVEWGGYLLLHNPANQTFIDGRMTQWQVNGESFLQRYVKTKECESGWADTLEKYKVDFVLIKPREPLANALRHLSERWKILYQDDVVVAFSRLG